MSRTEIIATLAVEGQHYWPAAASYSKQVGFLAIPHRHMFHIKAYRPVTHDDRDIEIIMFKRKLYEYLRQKFYSPTLNMLDFGTLSCEQLAWLIVEKFDCSRVEVMEDLENGAVAIQELDKSKD